MWNGATKAVSVRRIDNNKYYTFSWIEILFGLFTGDVSSHHDTQCCHLRLVWDCNQCLKQSHHITKQTHWSSISNHQA